jgi:hypothetical protein
LGSQGNNAWQEQIPEDQWRVYQRVIRQARDRDVPIALGGAFCNAHYTGRWRNTKDLDLYVLPKDRDRMIEAITRAGLEDYFDVNPYDRGWIYRAHSGESLVDAIWAMANRRAYVDERWIWCGAEADLRGERLRVVPAEEMIWDKLYILQRDRCDWPDVLNLIYATGATLDWPHLLERMGDDTALLAGLLSVYAWLSPDGARVLPEWVWRQLKLPSPVETCSSATCRFRTELLDTRPWFETDVERTRTESG